MRRVCRFVRFARILCCLVIFLSWIVTFYIELVTYSYKNKHKKNQGLICSICNLSHKSTLISNRSSFQSNDIKYKFEKLTTLDQSACLIIFVFFLKSFSMNFLKKRNVCMYFFHQIYPRYWINSIRTNYCSSQ